MKMYQLLEIQNIYQSICQIKMPIKTTYKFTKLAKILEEELIFYKEQFQKIIEQYGVKENGKIKHSDDGLTIYIAPEKQQECNEKILELQNLDIDIKDITFTIEELEGIDISISELNCLMSLIKE